MNFALTLSGLWRRWYIVFPGLIVAASVAVGAWSVIPPGYERSATQLLIPGADSLPEGANPYLFLGGLSPAADVLVRAIGAENVLNDVVEDHPGVQIEIFRDTTTAGPIILIVATASSDAAAEEVLGLLVDRTATVLDDIQDAENIPAANRVTVLPITVDTQSVLQQRSRLLGVAAAGIAGVLLTLLIAGLVEGLSMQRKRRGTSTRKEAGASDPVPGSVETVDSTSPGSTGQEPSTRLDRAGDDLVDEQQGPVVDEQQEPAAPPISSSR